LENKKERGGLKTDNFKKAVGINRRNAHY